MDKELKNNYYDYVIVMGQGALAQGVLQTALKHFDSTSLFALSLSDAAARFCSLSSFCSKFGVKCESSSSRKEISSLLNNEIEICCGGGGRIEAI